MGVVPPAYPRQVSKADFPHNERRTTLPCSPLVPRPAFDYLWGEPVSRYDIHRLTVKAKIQTRFLMQKYRAHPLTESEMRLMDGNR
jgi:hypothetical protein